MKYGMCLQCKKQWAVEEDGLCWRCATEGRGYIDCERQRTKKDLTVSVKITSEAAQVANKLRISHQELVKRALDDFVKREYLMSSKASDQVNGWD